MKIVGILGMAIVLISWVTPVYSPTRIVWEEKDKLSWDDFQADPDYDDDFASALTSSAIKYSYKCDDYGQLETSVRAEFLRDESWVKWEAYTDYHLNHEQLHFDITELYVRKIRMALEQRSFTCYQKSEFEGLMNDYLRQWRSFEMQYDMETNHSLLPEEQEKWNQIVPELLESYRAYE